MKHADSNNLLTLQQIMDITSVPKNIILRLLYRNNIKAVIMTGAKEKRKAYYDKSVLQIILPPHTNNLLSLNDIEQKTKLTRNNIMSQFHKLGIKAEATTYTNGVKKCHYSKDVLKRLTLPPTKNNTKNLLSFDELMEQTKLSRRKLQYQLCKLGITAEKTFSVNGIKKGYYPKTSLKHLIPQPTQDELSKYITIPDMMSITKLPRNTIATRIRRLRIKPVHTFGASKERKAFYDKSILEKINKPYRQKKDSLLSKPVKVNINIDIQGISYCYNPETGNYHVTFTFSGKEYHLGQCANIKEITQIKNILKEKIYSLIPDIQLSNS